MVDRLARMWRSAQVVGLNDVLAVVAQLTQQPPAVLHEKPAELAALRLAGRR